MKVLVTGAAGFLGRRLVPILAKRGYQIVAVDRNPNPGLDATAYYQGDISRSDVLTAVREPVEAIIHLAADVDVCAGYDNIVDNVYGVFVLCRWAEEKAVRRFIFPSTIGIFDVGHKPEQANESSPIAPSSLYAMSKYLGECCLKASRVRFIILRFPYLYGPGDARSTLADIIRFVLSGQAAKIRNERRDYLHIDDAIQAILKALEYRGEEACFNVGSGALVEMKDLAEMIARICGLTATIEISGLRNNLAADPSLAMRELEWKPTRSLSAGLQEQVAYLGGAPGK